MSSHPLHIGIVTGEPSGDRLGAGLIEAIRERVPGAVFEGIGGPKMVEAGCFSLHPMEKLSVMGLTDVIGRLPGLLATRRDLGRHFLETPPDIFIGIDAPDFNLPLERRLKAAGVRTLHYVSPSVWAWRRYRLNRIARSIDGMLVLFPFEEACYQEKGIPVRYVGHPLADTLADDTDPREARRHLGLDEHGKLVALLPGSRRDEVRRLADPFIRAAMWCHERRIDMRFVVPFATGACREIFETRLRRLHCKTPMTLLNGKSLEAMAACDAALLASGTASLECLLLKRPMVVAYRLSPVNYLLAKRLVQTRYFSLPNLLSNEPLVRELVQDEVRPENLGREVLRLIEQPERSKRLVDAFYPIHESLRRDASRKVADTVFEMVGRHEALV
jgi:lipid-A-disaccharide synthase